MQTRLSVNPFRTTVSQEKNISSAMNITQKSERHTRRLCCSLFQKLLVRTVIIFPLYKLKMINQEWLLTF